MIYNIETNNFSLAVKEMGAELNSFKSKKTGFEYIWGGNTEIWYGQSPILFPIIGRLLDDKYRLDGIEYTMPKHGIVRKKPFKLVKQTENSLIFIQSDDEDSLKSYPYHFDLEVDFTVTENGLSVTHTVFNKDDKVMYYSFGAHPAFNCEIGDYLEFDNSKLSSNVIDYSTALYPGDYNIKVLSEGYKEAIFPVSYNGESELPTVSLFESGTDITQTIIHTTETISDLKYESWKISVENGVINYYGGSQEAIDVAKLKVKNNCMNGNVYTGPQTVTYLRNYEIDDVMVGGNSLKDYKIVIKQGDEVATKYAQYIKDYIENVYKYYGFGTWLIHRKEDGRQRQ